MYTHLGRFLFFFSFTSFRHSLEVAGHAFMLPDSNVPVPSSLTSLSPRTLPQILDFSLTTDAGVVQQRQQGHVAGKGVITTAKIFFTTIVRRACICFRARGAHFCWRAAVCKLRQAVLGRPQGHTRVVFEFDIDWLKTNRRTRP